MEIRKITDLLSEKWDADKENFKFKGDSMLFLGDTLILGTDENILIVDETQKMNDSMMRRLEKIKNIMNSWYSKDYYYLKVFARSLASKSYLASQLLHLFPNTYIDENSLLETQKAIDKYVNKKVLMPKKNLFLNIQDGGTSTPNLYLLYLSAKVTWITK